MGLEPVRAVTWRLGASSLLLGLLLLAAGGCGESAGPPDRLQTPEVTRGSGVSSSRDSIQQLSVMKGLPEPVPARLKKVGYNPVLKVRWKQAQRLPVSYIDVWAVPASGGTLCLLKTQRDGTAAFVCAAKHHFLREGLYIASVPTDSAYLHSTRRVIVGVAPDGNRAVILHAPGYRTAELPVRHNTFVLRDSSQVQPETVQLIRR
jgi:hypothetical protein